METGAPEITEFGELLLVLVLAVELRASQMGEAMAW
jgi:hypothetical protein